MQLKPSEHLKFSRPLWQHQADTIDRFANDNEIALLHDMGVGKTTTAIGIMRWKFCLEAQTFPVLIISPVATLHNWAEEIRRNAPEKVSSLLEVLHGSLKKRASCLTNPDKKIFITNPEILDSAVLSNALKEKGFRMVIVDECHRFKNPRSKRLTSLLSISDKATYKVMMTGTPILNSYLDLWAQWRVLDEGKTFGRNFFVFRETYFRDANLAWKGKPKYFPHYVPRPNIEPVLSSLIDKKASRRTKAECLTLPPLVNKTEHVELSKAQHDAYCAMEEELIAQVKAGTCVATNALVKVLRMLQILSGYIQIETHETFEKFSYRLKENPRLQRLVELLEEITVNHKVIVWAAFTENYKMIRDACTELGLEYAELTGETKDRQSEIDKFCKTPSCKVFISNPQAGACGINLVEASYAIYYSRSFSLGDRLQSEGRNHRGGSEQHDKITHIDLVAPGTLDEVVLAALQRKEEFSSNILERLNK